MRKVCVLCGRKLLGRGNNPFPLRRWGVCCDDCNFVSVLPYRFKLLEKLNK